MSGPIVVVPGFGETQLSFSPFLQELVQTKRRVVFIGSPRWGGDTTGTYPAPLQRLANNLAQKMRDHGVAAATGIFHSMSGLSGLVAAHENPELFDRIIIVCGAGFMPDERVGRLVKTVGHKTLRTLGAGFRHPNADIRRANLFGLLDGALYIAANPWRALSEARGVANFRDGANLIQQVQEHGIEVYMVLASDDCMYDLTAMQTALSFMPEGRVLEFDGVHDLQYDAIELMKALQKYVLI